jgi:integrase
LQTKEIEDFKTDLALRVAPTTVNKAVKVLKAALNAAVKVRQLEFNPAQHVQFIEQEESNRRPFTKEELGKLMKAVKGEWKTMVMLGFYTGQRLRDCANLTWQEVGGTVGLTTMKTGRSQDVPIADPLSRHLSKIAGDKPDAPLCPTFAGKKASWLSAEFYKVMVKAGIVQKRSHQSTGKGRDGKRDTGQISFHSLRHNATSALKSAGVSDAVAMDIIGHETKAISRNYTSIELDAKKAAVAKLPDITI